MISCENRLELDNSIFFARGKERNTNGQFIGGGKVLYTCLKCGKKFEHYRSKNKKFCSRDCMFTSKEWKQSISETQKGIPRWNYEQRKLIAERMRKPRGAYKNWEEITQKVCKNCGVTKLVQEFYSVMRSDRYKSSSCKECQKVKSVMRHIEKKFGLTTEGYKKLYEQQMGLCAICHKPELRNKILSVDHDHANGNIRGLLCQLCNTGLGHFHDSVDLLIKATKYVQKYSI